MDDEFLARYREQPRPEFSKRLHERINQPMNQPSHPWRQTLTRWSPALLAATVLVAAVLLFTFPPALAAAQGFLDLFRVKKFAVVSIDPSRLQQLDQIDIGKLLGDQVKVLHDPGNAEQVASPAVASQRAGFNVQVPSTLPANSKLETYVQGQGQVQVKAEVEKLQSVLDTLGINDVQIPAALNGAQVTITKPASVMLHYTFAKGNVTLMESPSPTVDLPPGVNLAQLGEIGLRVAGLSKDDAHAMAQKIDWSSTFLIPIPTGAAQFRQVTINGADGLMITSNGTFKPQSKQGTGKPDANQGKKQAEVGRGSPYAPGNSVILWANGGIVYAVQGNESAVNLLDLANSIH